MSPHVVRWIGQRPPCLLLFALLAACGGGGGDIVDPPPPPDTDFTLTVRAHQDDAAVAQQLGWTRGLPNVQVTIAPADGSAPGQVLTTSADGTATLDALAPGDYRISALRLLTPTEQARLGAGSSVAAFVSEVVVTVSASTRTATVQLPASYRRSLVISEWSFTPRYILGSGTYQYGGYLELYNNSDTTVYLDGVLFASAFHMVRDLPHLSCAASAASWNDPAGLWASGIAAFPGTGRQYPLARGAHVVVATDAIDHSVLFPGMLDLRGADFEFIGPADVDNPTVPNMLDVGTRTVIDHGMAFPGGLSAVAVLGAATDPATLLRGTNPEGRPWLRIDRDGILDVFATAATYFAALQPPPTFCSSMIHPSFDRQPGVFLEEGPDEYAVSQSRKVLATLPDGRKLLQHTRTSANDFHRTLRSPGTVQ